MTKKGRQGRVAQTSRDTDGHTIPGGKDRLGKEKTRSRLRSEASHTWDKRPSSWGTRLKPPQRKKKKENGIGDFIGRILWENHIKKTRAMGKGYPAWRSHTIEGPESKGQTG